MAGVIPARYNILIAGGGPAGLAAAIALLRQGLSVLVVERNDYNSLRVGEHLPPSAKPLLASLGLSALLAAGRHAPCAGIRSVWGTSEPVDKDYIFHPHGEGANLGRPEFDQRVALHACSIGAKIVTRAKVLNVSRASGAFEIAIAAERKRLDVRAEFVIDATGRNASISKRFGARPIVYDDLVGIVGRAVGSPSADRLLSIEALECGWWYSAGLADGSVVTTFLTDPDLADTSRAGRAVAWRQQLRGSVITSARIPADSSIGEIHIRTARTQRLDRAVGDGWLAVGDAAMSFDPLSSDGISKGLEWGRKAAGVAAACCQGDRSLASAYQRDLDKIFSDYLVTRCRYYRAEKRWPHAQFWQRRQAVPPRIAKIAG